MSSSWNVAEIIKLRTGFSWHPNEAAPTGVIARLPDPSRAGAQITKWRAISNLSVAQVKRVISELDKWREDMGRRLWPSWPDVYRKTAASLRETPQGVSCHLKWSGSRNGQKYAMIAVTAYWQDYSKPKPPGGRYPQGKRVWHLPTESSNADIDAVIEEAALLRRKMTAKLKKPLR